MPAHEGTGTAAAALPAARIAISVAFLVFGAVFGLWAAHIPSIAGRLHLDPAIIGIALLMIGLGGVVSQPIAGALVPRLGSRLLSAILTPAMLIAFLLPLLAWNTPVVIGATLVFGLAAGGCNVALNTQASEIERARGKPTMSSFHGFFSLGALVGAALGGAIIAVGWQDGRGAAVVVIASLAIVIFTSRYYLASPPAAAATKVARTRFALPPALVLALAAIAFIANMVEGAVADWSALYLSSVRHIDPALAVSGYALFAAAMTVFRLSGGPVVAALGERSTVLVGGVLMATGMTVVVFSPWDSVSPFGFALVALGAANNIPVIIGAASRIPGIAPSTGVAAAATGNLLGLLIGPPVIGFIAHATSLSTALALLCLSGVIVAVSASLYPWPAASHAAPDSV